MPKIRNTKSKILNKFKILNPNDLNEIASPSISLGLAMTECAFFKSNWYNRYFQRNRQFR